jgi:glycosyltransferase involved in cell wall biosynthesis
VIAPIPVLLHRHNFERLSGNIIRRWWKQRRLGRLSRLSFVSEAARDHFSKLWPQGPRAEVVPNGLDMRLWQPTDKGRREILVVGRAVGVKGILPAALGVEQALRDLAGWQATFVLSSTHEEPEYFRQVAEVVSRTPRARLLLDQPFARVKAMTEDAEIAIVPSVWSEPFGRTALEALAGGAALITSGRGGLREVAGEAAWWKPRSASDRRRKNGAGSAFLAVTPMDARTYLVSLPFADPSSAVAEGKLRGDSCFYEERQCPAEAGPDPGARRFFR